MFFNSKKQQKENIKKIILASLGLVGTVGIAKLLYNKYKNNTFVDENLTEKIKNFTPKKKQVQQPRKKPYIQNGKLVYLTDQMLDNF